MKSNIKCIMYVLLFFILSSWCYPQSFTIITHKDNKTDRIDSTELQQMFLGEKILWSDGTPVKLAVLKKGTAHKQFLKEIVKMTPLKFKTYWKRKVFTGTATGTSIRYFTSDDEVKEYVAKNPGAIGYINTANLDTSVKRLRITGQ